MLCLTSPLGGGIEKYQGASQFSFLLFAKAFLAVAPFVPFLAIHRKPLKIFCWLMVFQFCFLRLSESIIQFESS
jgi:hypothetical protein